MKRKLFLTTSQILLGGVMIALIVFFTGCGKSDIDSKTNPEELKNLKIENIEGGSIINYDLITDQEVKLIMAEILNEDGTYESFRFKAIENTSSIVLKGFLPGTRLVTLYVVDRLGNRSETTKVEIDPLISQTVVYLNSILESVVATRFLNRASLSFENNEKNSELIFDLAYEDDLGNWVEYGQLVSDQVDGVLLTDDFPYTKIRIFLTNVLGDKSTTQLFTLPAASPEILLEKSKWSNAKLPGDNWQGTPAFENLWNDNQSTSGSRFESIAAPFPQVFTIDLGVDQGLILTKIKVHQYAFNLGNSYNAFVPREFEIWGSNNPDAEGSWDGWKKLANCVSIKPSGPLGTPVTAADRVYALGGEEFSLSLTDDVGVYRYIRFKTISTWGVVVGPQAIRIHEITLWGMAPNL